MADPITVTHAFSNIPPETSNIHQKLMIYDVLTNFSSNISPTVYSTPLYIVPASVAALPPPGFETLSMVDLLQYQADHLDFCCVSTTMYLDLVLLCICRCVSAAVYPLLCIRHCVSATVSTVLYIHYCICCCSSTTVYLLLCICRHVSAAVYIVLCILNYFCISATVFLPLCICCCGSAAIYLPLCIYPCVSTPVNVYHDPVLYIWHCIWHCVSATVYISATVYPPLYICHCVCYIVESDRVQREIELIVYQTI